MTGRDLIIYILQNNLEDTVVFKHGRFLDFMTVSETAAKFGVGVATVRVWLELNMIQGILIGNEYYIPQNVKPTDDLAYRITNDVIGEVIKNHSRKE